MVGSCNRSILFGVDHLVSVARTIGILASIGVATAGALASSKAQAAGRVFFDSFEAGDTSLWSPDGDRNPCIVVTAALDLARAPLHGNRMLRCNWNGTLAWNDPARFETLVLKGWNYADEFLIRFWIRRDADAADHAANGPKYYRIGTNSGSDVSFGAINFRTGIQTASFFGSGGGIGTTYWGSGSRAADGAWHKVEIYVKNSTTQGVVRLWEDDVRVWEAVNANTVQTASWTPFRISSNWSGAEGCCDHDASNHIYWDSVEVYSDVGTGGVGNLSDGSIQHGTMPQPPKDVVVE